MAGEEGNKEARWGCERTCPPAPSSRWRPRRRYDLDDAVSEWRWAGGQQCEQPTGTGPRVRRRVNERRFSCQTKQPTPTI